MSNKELERKSEIEKALYSGNFFSINGNNGYDLGNNNKWDDGSFGNYWSDYTGKDTNTDGTGDTPYIIPKNGIDNRPMINPRK